MSDVAVCPNGHANFEKIPIIYCLLSYLGKAEKDRTPEERKLAGQIKRREIIWGGCCLDDQSHLLRCQKCGFELHHYEGRPRVDLWTRNGTRPDHLESFSSHAQKLVGGSALKPLSWATNQQLLNGRLAHEQIDFEILPAQLDSLRDALSKRTRDLKGLTEAPFHEGSVRPDGYYVRVGITMTEAQHIHVALIVCDEAYAAKWLPSQPGIPAALR